MVLELLNQGRVEEARNIISEVFDENDENYWLILYLLLHESNFEELRIALIDLENQKNLKNKSCTDIFNLFYYLEKQQIDMAKKYYDNLTKDNQNRNITLHYLEILAKGIYLRRIQKEELALQFLAKIENIPSNKYILIHAIYENNLGNHNFKKDLKKSICHFLKSFEYYQILNDDYNLMKLASNIGVVYSTLEDMQKASEYINLASEFATKIADIRAYSIIMFNLGQINWKRGELEEAINCFKSCKPYFEEINDKEKLIHISLNFGVIYNLKGDIRKSRNHLITCLNHYKETNNIIGLKSCYTNLGYSNLRLGNFEDAFSDFKKSLDIIEELQEIDQHKQEVLYHLYILSLLIENEKNDYYYNKLLEHPDEGYTKLAIAKEFQRTQRLRNIVMAQDIYNEILNNNTFSAYIKELAILEQLDILIDEYRSARGDDIILEIKKLSNQLDYIAKNQNSYWLIAKSLLLKSKIALINLDTELAKKYLDEAQKLAEEKKYASLAITLSNELDNLIQELEIIERSVDENSELITELGVKGFGDILRQIMYKKVENKTYEEEKPVLFMILTKGGISFYSKRFDTTLANEQLIGGFLTSANAILKEAFSYGGNIERIKQKEYTLLFKSDQEVMYCYALKGISYYGTQKLERLVNELKQDVNWQHYLRSANYGKIEKNMIKLVDSKIKKIFH